MNSAQALLPVINPAVTSKYGIEISSFIVENVSLPPEVEQSIDKRSSMAAVGNLNDYIKFQMAESLAKGEGGGLAGSRHATWRRPGDGPANRPSPGQRRRPAQPARCANRSAVPPVVPISGTGAAAASAEPEMLTPADAALILNVSENDVISALADGSLKGKKIGASWRITRAALDDFLKT